MPRGTLASRSQQRDGSGGVLGTQSFSLVSSPGNSTPEHLVQPEPKRQASGCWEAPRGLWGALEMQNPKRELSVGSGYGGGALCCARNPRPQAGKGACWKLSCVVACRLRCENVVIKDT